MSMNKYLAFLKTVELGNITRAAEELGYTQSAVSRIIADLEQEWNLTLLTRNRTGVVLSSDGEQLLPHVRAICNAHRELTEQVSELHGLTRGTIRIGTFTSISVHWLPEIMKAFLSCYPGIQFQLVSSMEYAEIEEWISKGEVDCGFIGLPAVLPLDTVFLRRDRILAVLPPDHPLVEAPCYPVRRFAEEPFIRLDDVRDREYSRIFERYHIRPEAQYTVNDDYAVISMVSNGLGVSLLPELVLRRTSYPIITKPLDIPQFRDIGIAVRSSGNASPVTARFLSFVQGWMEGDGELTP